MSHEALKHLMMPSQPGPSFVVVHSHFALRLFERSFDWPAQAADPHEFGDRAMRGCIAQIEFLFGLHSQAAPTDKPLPNVWQAITNRGDPQYCEFCDQGALAAFMDQMTMPGGLRQIHSQDPQLFGQGRTASDAAMQAGMAPSRGPRLFDRWRAQPDPRVGGHLRHIPFVQRRNGLRKRRIFRITFVICDPLERNGPAPAQLLQHFQSQLPFCVKMHRIGQAADFPQFTVIRAKPFLWNVQPFIQKSIAPTTHISQKHTFLTICNLAYMTTILRRGRNRVLALFGKAAAIYNRHAITLSQPCGYQALQFQNERAGTQAP